MKETFRYPPITESEWSWKQEVHPVVICRPRLSLWERFKRLFFVTKQQKVERLACEIMQKLIKHRIQEMGMGALYHD